MYIECTDDGVGRVGWVTFSRTGRSAYYRDIRLARFTGRDPYSRFKENYRDTETGAWYWLSGCKRAGGDRLYPGYIDIDADAREEYWVKIRQCPARRDESRIHCSGKYGQKRGPRKRVASEYKNRP